MQLGAGKSNEILERMRLLFGSVAELSCNAIPDEMYSSYYTEADYPMTKVLQDPVYVELHILEQADLNIVLVLKHCWATKNPDSFSEPQWDLVVDG